MKNDDSLCEFSHKHKRIMADSIDILKIFNLKFQRGYPAISNWTSTERA